MINKSSSNILANNKKRKTVEDLLGTQESFMKRSKWLMDCWSYYVIEFFVEVIELFA